jgi:hypothetical protein
MHTCGSCRKIIGAEAVDNVFVGYDDDDNDDKDDIVKLHCCAVLCFLHNGLHAADVIDCRLCSALFIAARTTLLSPRDHHPGSSIVRMEGTRLSFDMLSIILHDKGTVALKIFSCAFCGRYLRLTDPA